MKFYYGLWLEIWKTLHYSILRLDQVKAQQCWRFSSRAILVGLSIMNPKGPALGLSVPHLCGNLVSTKIENQLSCEVNILCRFYWCFLFCFLINWFLARLGLWCWAQAFSSSRERMLLFFVVCRLLLLQSMGPRVRGFSSCSSQALEHELNSCAARA